MEGNRPFKVSSKSIKKSIKGEPPLVCSNEWQLKLEPSLVGTNAPVYKQVYLFIVGSGSFMSPQLRTVGKKNVSHWLRSGRKIEVELDVKLRSNWM